ncbi:phosphotransferase family protein [Streptomyces sp. NPDC050504]|uniref:phosphotransferase family protein n=1 Tax=Streptomyces sp. NPDC050504 TaxID=3365618 RepID=UPI003789AE71
MTTPMPIGEPLSALGLPEGGHLLESSPRSHVWRTALADGTPAIVKQTAEGGATTDGATRFAREVTALRLAGRAADPAVAPALLGTDPRNRVMVLELLEEQGASGGGDWLPGYADALARLHSVTGPADRGALPAWAGPKPADADAFLALAEALDVEVPPRAADQLGALLDRLDPAPHHALLHGDPCPGNDLRTSGGVRFIDFEHAALGNGLVELAYLRIGFPTCWCAMSVTGAPLEEAESVYRSTWRSRTGTDVPGDLADACAGWLVQGDALVRRAERETRDHLARVPVEDFAWGPSTARERLVHRLDVVAGLARDHDLLHAVGTLSGALADRLVAARPAPRPLPGADRRPWA